MTRAFGGVCLAELLYGLPAAFICAGVGALADTLRRPGEGRGRIQPMGPLWYRLALNLGNSLLSCLVAALAYHAVDAHAPSIGVTLLLGLAIFTAVYHAINTGGMSLALAFQRPVPWFSVWQQNFPWVAPGYLASACVSAGISIVYRQFHIWSLLFLPPAYLVHCSYRLAADHSRLQTDKMQREMAHAQELNQLNQLNQALLTLLAAPTGAKDSVTAPAEPDRAAMDAREATESGTAPVAAGPGVGGASG